MTEKDNTLQSLLEQVWRELSHVTLVHNVHVVFCQLYWFLLLETHHFIIRHTVNKC